MNDLYESLKGLSELSQRISLVNSVLHETTLNEWQLTSAIDKKTGQAFAFFVTNKRTKEQGVLKVYNLKKRKNSRDRFEREIKILDKYKGEDNIVEILGYDIDNGLYVTRKGKVLNEYWANVKKKSSGEELYSKAVDLLLKLSNGLSKLHLEGVTHRDIKPDNVIIINEEPYIIDFGICYESNSTRITLDGELMGNVEYSHNIMQSDLKEYPSWLDNFQLSQLFLWMICNKKSSSWPRPLDWRFVEYPKAIENNITLINKIRAFSAVCSDFYFCPKDASEMIVLIKNILKTENIPMNKSFKIDLSKISEAIKQGQSTSLLLRNELVSDYEVSKDLFKSKLDEILGALVSESGKEDYKQLPMEIKDEYSYELMHRFFYEGLESSSLATRGPSKHFIFGNTKRHFEIFVGGKYFKRTYLRTCPNFKEEFIPFIIEFVRQIPQEFHLNTQENKYGIFIHKNGTLYMAQNNEVRPQEVYDFREVNLLDIVEQFNHFVNDPGYWEMVHSKK